MLSVSQIGIIGWSQFIYLYIIVFENMKEYKNHMYLLSDLIEDAENVDAQLREQL